jgi:hypothetical protein
MEDMSDYNKDLEKEADRILRDAGNMREHGILKREDRRQAKEVLISDEEQLDDLAQVKWDRRSSSQSSGWLDSLD